MPVGKRKKRPPKYEWIGHIEIDFNDPDRDEVLKYVDTRTWDFEDVVSVLTQQDVGIKFTYNKSTDSYRVSLQPKQRDCYLLGYTLGYEHMDIVRLYQIATYIVDVMIEHEQIELPERRGVPDW